MKKVLLSILALVLVAVLSVGATLAYLQDEDGAVNVMTVGNVTIEQIEQERVDQTKIPTADNLQEFTQAKPLIPAVYSDSSIQWDADSESNQAWKVVDCDTLNVIDKFVQVKNTGLFEAYVRTVFAFEQGAFDDEDLIHIVINAGNVEGATWEWNVIGDTTIDTTTYELVVATYTTTLKSGETTIPSLKQIYLDKTADNDFVNALGNTYDVLVMSQAVQASGFKNGAANALDAAFGAVTTATHPWATGSVQHVSNTADLESAIASGANTLVLADGVYKLPATKNNSLTIIGAGNDVVIDLTASTAQNLTDIEFSNVTVKGTTTNYIGIQHSGDVVYNNCVFNESTTLYGESVTFNNCVFNLTSRYIWTYAANVVTFNNCVFNTDGKAVLVYAEDSVDSQVVNVNNCTFNATQTATTSAGDNCAAVEIDGSLIKGTYTVNFAGTNVVDADFAGLYRIKNQKNPENVTVNQNGSVVTTATVSSADALASVLTSNNEHIEVVLESDIDLPISSLGTITGGSGEYKLGGEDTKSITIDLNGKKLNITTTYWSALGAKNANATFTIKNGTMTSSQTSGTWNSYDLTFANCNYVIENVVFDKAVAFTNTDKSVVMNDVTINETHDYYAIWISAVGQNIEIDGLTVNSAGRGIKIDEQYVGTPAKVTLKVSDATFNTMKKAAILVKSASGADVTLNNVNISNVTADTTNAVWVDADAATHASLVTVTGGTVITES